VAKQDLPFVINYSIPR